jgi:hypothetical protein
MPQRITPNPLNLLRPVTKVQTLTKTRPADTTAYAAGDVISESTSAGTVWTFPFARSLGLGGILQDAALIQSVAQSTKLDADLYLFDTTIASNLNDNAAFAPSDAEMKTLLTVISFTGSNAKVGSGNVSIEYLNASRSLQCAAASLSLFGVLVARNAYVPTSGEDITLRLRSIQD